MRKLILALLVAATVPSVFAGNAWLLLRRRNTPQVVTDAAGFWQYEMGDILTGNVNPPRLLGSFLMTRRSIRSGTGQMSDEMLTLTLYFFSSEVPPRNVTLMGWKAKADVPAVVSGAGGVSAASAPFQCLQPEATFTLTFGTPCQGTCFSLVITWPGDCPFPP